MSWKKMLVTTLKIVLALGLLLYLYQSGHFSTQKLSPLIQWPLVMYGGLLLGVILLAAAMRFRALALMPLTVYQSWKLTLVGTFFSYFIPGGVGGDLVKGVMIKRGHDSSAGSAAFTVLIDRLVGLGTMSFLSVMAVLFVPESLQSSRRVQWLALFLVSLFLGIVSVLVLLLSRGMREKWALAWLPLLPRRLAQLVESFHAKQAEKSYEKSQIFRALSWSLASQFCSIFFFFLVAQIVFTEVDLPLATCFFVVPIGFMLTAIPISPGGIGVGQAAFLFLFQRALGFETNLGVIAISGFQFYSLVWGVLGAFYFVMAKNQTVSQDVSPIQ